MQLRQLLWTARVLGYRRLLSLNRARRLGYVAIVRGHYVTRVCITLFNVGMFDEFAAKGTVSVDAYARSHNLDPHIMSALCDYLVVVKILKRHEGKYSLHVKGHIIVKTLRGLFQQADAYEDVVHNLEPLLKQDMIYGKDVVRKPKETATASGAGGRLFTFPLVNKILEEEGLTHPLDLACGDGAFLIDLCQMNPRVIGYGVDIAPEAIELGRQRVREASLDDRIHLIVEDFYQLGKVADQLQQVDVVTSFYGFQELLALGRDKVLELLATLRSTFPSAAVIVCEIPQYSVEELAKRSASIAEYQLFHALTHQRLATRAEWMELWRTAGFSRIEEKHLAFARTVIYIMHW